MEETWQIGIYLFMVKEQILDLFTHDSEFCSEGIDHYGFFVHDYL